MTIVNGTSTIQSYEFLFLLDFIAQYPQSQCGASGGLDVGLLSIACILPYPVWVGMLVMVWYSHEVYFSFTQIMLTFMTIAQIALQFAFPRSPPIAGCGPSRSFPCPQVTLVSCGMSCLLRYSLDIKLQPDWKIFLGFSIVAFTMHAVMYLGFADGSSTLAATVVGSMFGYAEHEVVLLIRKWPKLLDKLKKFLEFITQRTLVDTIMVLPSALMEYIPAMTESTDALVKDPCVLPQALATSEIRFGLPA